MVPFTIDKEEERGGRWNREGAFMSKMCRSGYFRFQVGVEVQSVESSRVEKWQRSRGCIQVEIAKSGQITLIGVKAGLTICSV